MSLSNLGRLINSKVTTKQDLLNIAAGLDVALDCIDNFIALRDKGYSFGMQFRFDHYPIGATERGLVEMWRSSSTPNVSVLHDESNRLASRAGREFAYFLRDRYYKSAIVLRVYVTNKEERPRKILLRLLASLIWNLISLVPNEFDPSDDLRGWYFMKLMNHGSGSFDAGLRILEALPLLDLRGKRLLCIVDGLDLAEHEATVSRLEGLTAALNDVVGKNHGLLLYTVGKRCMVSDLYEDLIKT
ncbi:hypothetical protein GGR54DRAFT_346632 [Hypoxylon sp. NC1633]|nr:hypothetical protein GGR54DRAFT_346632 [Hypoxylon sp. NC1633]